MLDKNLESIYYDDCVLVNVLKCNKCGTIIESSMAEEYDPNLQCPCCTGYKTVFFYITLDDVKESEFRYNALLTLSKYTDDQYERRMRRHGKEDNELYVKIKYRKNLYKKIELLIDDVTESHIRGLRLSIKKGLMDSHGIVNDMHHVVIPLGITSLGRLIKYGTGYLKNYYN